MSQDQNKKRSRIISTPIHIIQRRTVDQHPFVTYNLLQINICSKTQQPSLGYVNPNLQFVFGRVCTSTTNIFLICYRTDTENIKSQPPIVQSSDLLSSIASTSTPNSSLFLNQQGLRFLTALLIVQPILIIT